MNPTCWCDLGEWCDLKEHMETMEIRWTCLNCGETSNQEREVWEDIYGEYVAFECPNCLEEHVVYLESKVA